MTDSGQPKYGQYATPEEQRARMGQPPVAPQPVQPVVAPPEAQSAPEAQPSTRSATSFLIDRIITVALLAYGLISVIRTMGSMVDVQKMFTAAGMTVDLSDPAAARAWGIAAAIVYASGFVLTALWAFRRLARSKWAFWVPIVGAIVFTVISSILIVIPLLGDPGAIESILEWEKSLAQ
ncbi:MAG: DUF6264 family protein [Microbacterium sp.]